MKKYLGLCVCVHTFWFGHTDIYHSLNHNSFILYQLQLACFSTINLWKNSSAIYTKVSILGMFIFQLGREIFHVYNMPIKLGIYVLMYSIYLTFLAIVHIISIIIYLTMSVCKKTIQQKLWCVQRLRPKLHIQILTLPPIRDGILIKLLSCSGVSTVSSFFPFCSSVHLAGFFWGEMN